MIRAISPTSTPSRVITLLLALLALFCSAASPAQELQASADGIHTLVMRHTTILYWSENEGCPGGEFAAPCRIYSMSARPTDFGAVLRYESDQPQTSIHSQNIAVNDFGAFAWLGESQLLSGPDATALATRTITGNGDEEVAADDDYFYWTEGDRIMRTPVAGGTTELVVDAPGDVAHLVADGAGGVLYTASFGILYHTVPGATAGSFTTVIGPGNVLALAVDDTHVYAVGLTGGVAQNQTLYRAPLANVSAFTAGVQIGSGTEGDTGVGSMTANTNTLFWYKTGDGLTSLVVQRLQKIDWTGSPSSIESISLPLANIDDLVANDNYVFYRDPGAVRRIDLEDAVNISASLSIAEVVVNQGVSGIDDFLLIEDKPGIVWVEPSIDALEGIGQVTARVELRRLNELGSQVPGTEVLTQTKTLDGTPVNRDDPATVFNFELPREWRTGGGSILATIRPVGVAGSAGTDSAILPPEGFRPKTHVCVKFLPIWMTGTNTYWVTPPDRPAGYRTPGFMDILRRFETVYPVPELRWYTQSRVIRKPQFLGPARPFNMAANTSGPSADSDHLMAALFEHNIYDSAPDYCGGQNARTHYVAMIPASVNTTFGGRTVNARGSFGEPFAWLKMRNTGTTFNSANAGLTMAHEFGHNTNNLFGTDDHWQHVNCGIAPGAGFNDLYPFDHCTFGLSPEGPGDNNGTGGTVLFEGWGTDRISGERIRFTEASDYLSSTASRWASFYRWQQAMGKIEDKPGASRTAAARARTASDVIVMTGVLDDTENTIEVLSLNHFPPGFVVPDVNTELSDHCMPASLYELVVEDPSGSELIRHKINPTCSEDDGPEGGFYFVHTRAHVPDAAMLRIVREDSEELWAFEITEKLPQVQILTPSPGESLSGPFTIAWDATDDDSPILSYTVQYRIDGADTPWMLLATGLDTTELNIESNNTIPGSGAAEIRVIATDGFNIGMAVVEPLDVEDKPPAPAILYPLPGESFAITERVTLEGRSFDPEQGEVALDWTLNGPAATSAAGREAPIDDLPPGLYTLTLDAVDARGNTGSATSSLVIEDKFVPDTDAPAFDGACEDDEYGDDATPITLRYATGQQATARFVHHASHLYVCIADLEQRVSATNSMVTLSFDADASSESFPQSGDFTVRMFQNGFLQTQSGGSATWTLDAAPAGVELLVTSAGATRWAAEARIDLSRLGGWNHFGRIGLSHADFITGETFKWPLGFDATNPSSWAHTAFGGDFPQSIAFPAIPDTLLETAWVAASASASSGLPVHVVSDNEDVCSVDLDNQIHLNGLGTCRVTASQPGNDVYAPAAPVERSFEVIDTVPDSDGDGAPDDVDNCVLDANPDQVDTDSDGIGNACDPDLNNDCFVNFIDLSLFRPRFFSSDPDADFNTDGMVNFIDLSVMQSFFFQPPGPAGGANLCQ